MCQLEDVTGLAALELQLDARKLTKAPAVPSAASSFALVYPIFLAGAPDARGAKALVRTSCLR